MVNFMNFLNNKLEDGECHESYETEQNLNENENKLVLKYHGNPRTLNIPEMIVQNVRNSDYYQIDLLNITTYLEAIDEIYYKVKHLEPWEKGTRKMDGNFGMCGEVRGVSAGGVPSTAFCILFKLNVYKLNRNQVYMFLNHKDSPYIRGIGFLFLRFATDPSLFWDWMSPYLEDEEEITVRANAASSITIGEMVRELLTIPNWYGAVLPRIPVIVQKKINENLSDRVALLRKQKRSQEMNADKWSRNINTDKRSNVSSTRRRSRSSSKERSRHIRRISYSSSADRSRSKRSRSPNDRSRRYVDSSVDDKYSRSNKSNSKRYRDDSSSYERNRKRKRHGSSDDLKQKYKRDDSSNDYKRKRDDSSDDYKRKRHDSSDDDRKHKRERHDSSDDYKRKRHDSSSDDRKRKRKR